MAWKKTVTNGVDPATLQAAAERYGDYCRRTITGACSSKPGSTGKAGPPATGRQRQWQREAGRLVRTQGPRTRRPTTQKRLRLSHALVSLSLKVARRSGEDEQIEARIEHYADQLMAWPEPLAIACLAEHPKRSIYWPAWKELEDLRAELETEYRDRQIGLPPPGGENFRERLVRLGWPRSGAKIGMALAKIGAAKYRAVISRQHELSDPN